MYRGGLNYMRYSVSDTAEHGDYTGGPRLVTAETKKEMRRMLDEIRSGQYARGWIEENQTGRKWFEGRRREERGHEIERVGADLRALMSFLKPVTIPNEDAVGAGAKKKG
jgi:ketol-acid reductoisomerase